MSFCTSFRRVRLMFFRHCFPVTCLLYTRGTIPSSGFCSFLLFAQIYFYFRRVFVQFHNEMPIVGLTMRFSGIFLVACYIYYNNVAYAYTYAHTRKNRITEPFVNVFNNFTAGKFCSANQSVLVKSNTS